MSYGMMGTDLFQAYEQQPTFNNNSPNPLTNDQGIMEAESIHPSLSNREDDDLSAQQSTSANISNPPQNAHTMQIPPSSNHYQSTNAKQQFYDQGNELNLQKQLYKLQAELKTQKESQHKDGILDMYISKRKDVGRLVCMSLTILFAVSIHFVVGDVLRMYLINTDLTTHQQLFTKLSYPITVLVLMWSVKVFNR
jgi:hypothetical protein